MLNRCVIYCFLYLNLVLGLGFPVCPEDGVLNCLNESDFVVSSATTTISNCIYIGCPSLIIDSSIALINNVTFKDSIAPSVSIAGGSYVNISNVKFYNSSLSVDGISSIFYVINCFFKSTRMEVTGSGHNIIIEDSQFIDNNTPDSGGAIFINPLDQTISFYLSGCLFTQNSASIGGALFLYALKSAYIFNSTFTENFSDYVGALLITSIEVQISGCKFIRNSANSQSGAVRIEQGGSALIENSLFLENTAANIGAISLFSLKSAIFSNCHFEGNSGDNGDGSILAIQIYSYLLVDSCTFLNNSSPNGYAGSLRLFSVKSCTVTNSSFTLQSAGEYSGSIYSEYSNMVMLNCNFFDCHSNFQGGVMILSFYTNTMLINTVFKSTFSHEGGVIIALYANLVMINCTQSDSEAFAGASILLRSSNATIQKCQFMNNTASSRGGAIYVWDSVVSISGTYFYNGTAIFGGQIFIEYGEVSISNCTFDLNSASKGGFMLLDSLKDKGQLSISSSVITNSFASDIGGALLLFTSSSSNILIQDCSFYNSSSAKLYGHMLLQGYGPVIITNCEFVNSFSLNNAIGRVIAPVYFTNCLFLNSVSLTGTGNLQIQLTAHLLNCTIIGAKGGFALVQKGARLFASSSMFSDISAHTGGIIYGAIFSSVIFTGCSFEAVTSVSLGVIAFTRGYVEVNDCELHLSETIFYSSSLFYINKKTSLLIIDGLRIIGKIPDIDGSIVSCQFEGTVYINRLSFSSSQSILQSVFVVDIHSSITISDSSLIDFQCSSLIKASVFSKVTVINTSISYSEVGASPSMDQVFSLENGCILSLISSKISNFQGTVAVILALGGSSFNCSNSTIMGSTVLESAVKLYNGQMTSNNCSFKDNTSIGNVNECISNGLGKSIVALGGAIFGYSSSINLTGGTIFSGNEADLGGAIYCVNCEMDFDDVIFGNNTAGLLGGALWSDSCNVQIGNCQVSANKALNLPASNDFFLLSGQLSLGIVSSNISVYIGDDSLSNYILSNSSISTFTGLRGLAKTFSIMEYSDTLYINSTSDFLPSLTVVALDVFNQIVSIDPNDPIIIQVSLEDNKYSSYLSGESSKLMVTEKAIFSDLAVVGKVPGESYNITISSYNRPEISSKSVQVRFQECDFQTQVLVKGTTCVPLLAGNSSGVITLISVFWMITFLIIVVSLVYLHEFRHYDLIKVNSFTFLFVSGIGSLISVSAPLFYLSDHGCIPAIFLERIGFTLVFAALSLKVYRINTIFNSMSRSGLQNSRLIRILGILVLIVFSYLLAWVIIDPPKVTLTYSSQLNVVIKNSCPMDSPFVIAIEMAQFSAVLFLSYLAFLTRGIPEKFNEAKLIGFACYNWLLFGSFFYLMAEYFIASPGLKIVIKVLSLYTSHLIITASLITLKVYRVYKLRLQMEEENSCALDTSANASLSTSLFNGIFLKTPSKSMLSVTERTVKG